MTMDFSYEYTDEQQRFRARVSEWLDANVPGDVDALLDSPGVTSTLPDLAIKLGCKGWLAPSEPVASGGAGLSPDLTVIALEELNRRGLLRLVDGEAQALRCAIGSWDSTGQRADLVRSLATGEVTVWRHRIALSRQDGDVILDPDSVGITATPDADGYLLNGAGMYTGHGAVPDILWTVALVQPGSESRSDLPEPVCLVIDATSDGIAYPSTRTLSAAAPTPVSFDDVWVLRTDALGPEGEGRRALTARVTLDPRADLPSWVESETDALIEYARTNELGDDPIRALLLVEAYIASRVSRLLRMRAAWLEQTGGETRTAASLASLSRRAAASELSDTARQVVGPTALLAATDPRAADMGRFDRVSRRELAERDGSASGDTDREAIASALDLGKHCRNFPSSSIIDHDSQ